MIQGGVDPNKSYLGVSALSLAVEAGDVGMVRGGHRGMRVATGRLLFQGAALLHS